MKASILVCVAVLGVSLSALAGQPNASPNYATTTRGNAIIAQLQNRQLQIDEALAPIKDEVEFQSYMLAHREGSPFDALSPMDRQVFINSIRFGPKGGVATLNFDVLKPLTPTQVYNVLSLFGLQMYSSTVGSTNIQTAADKAIMGTLPLLKPPLAGYACNGKHSCYPYSNHWCTTQC